MLYPVCRNDVALPERHRSDDGQGGSVSMGFSKLSSGHYNVVVRSGDDTSDSAAKEKLKNRITIDSKLKVRMTGGKISIAWGLLSDADYYVVYGAYCGSSFYHSASGRR